MGRTRNSSFNSVTSLKRGSGGSIDGSVSSANNDRGGDSSGTSGDEEVRPAASTYPTTSNKSRTGKSNLPAPIQEEDEDETEKTADWFSAMQHEAESESKQGRGSAPKTQVKS